MPSKSSLGVLTSADECIDLTSDQCIDDLATTPSSRVELSEQELVNHLDSCNIGTPLTQRPVVPNSKALKRKARCDENEATPLDNKTPTTNKRIKQGNDCSTDNTILPRDFWAWIEATEINLLKRAPEDDNVSETTCLTVESDDSLILPWPTSAQTASPSQDKITYIDSSEDSDEESVVANACSDDDDDDVQIVLVKKCIKEKRKKKIYPVLNASKNTIDNVKINGFIVGVGSFVEFKDGTFMEVQTIYPDVKHDFILVGKVFTRITDTEIVMPTRKHYPADWKSQPNDKIARLPLFYKGDELINEVCQRIMCMTGEAPADFGLWPRTAQEVKFKRELCYTYQNYGATGLVTQNFGQDSSLSMSEHGILMCRWVETIIRDEYGTPYEHRFERLQPSNGSCRLASQEESRAAWRGTTRNLALSGQIPDMFDAFCGAGGMSVAAIAAGFNVKMSFDIDERKIATHSLNIPNCISMNLGVFEWIQWAKSRDLRVEVLHLSPPCQPFSQANTTPNIIKNEINQAALLSVGEVVQCLRPRIVTIEEANGIVKRHKEWFAALIHQLTELNFSVSWSILNCYEYGVPQTRKRLFLIAAGPGEQLPPFPEPTHRLGDISIGKTLSEIEIVHAESPLTQHEVEKCTKLQRTPYDPDRLANTITCKGGENYHPSGLRQFTVREFAALQTFPMRSFTFPEHLSVVEQRTQAGNAVPPAVGTAVLRSVLKSLIECDKKRLAAFGGNSQDDPIEL